MLMFADDIALIADTIIGLQKQLNLLCQFCTKSKLIVNIAKTKVLVFKRGGQLALSKKWMYSGSHLESVSGFTYVGIYFTNRLSMFKMAESMSVKAKKSVKVYPKFISTYFYVCLFKLFLRYLIQRLQQLCFMDLNYGG